jgi:hypothetical protein
MQPLGGVEISLSTPHTKQIGEAAGNAFAAAFRSFAREMSGGTSFATTETTKLSFLQAARISAGWNPAASRMRK